VTLEVNVAQYPTPRALTPYGFNVERDTFDAMLLDRARELGVEVVEGATAREVVISEGRSVGVEIAHPDGRRLVGSRFVVDASGKRCLLGHQLGLVKRREQAARCALFAWFRGESADVDSTLASIYLLGRAQGWAWRIPLRDDVTSIGVVSSCANLRGGEPDRLFMALATQNATFRRVTHGAQRVTPWEATGNYEYQLECIHGPGWLLVGDAAGFIDPIFASGVDIAMHSAVLAYEALLPLLLLRTWNAEDEARALEGYEARLRRGLVLWRKSAELFYTKPATLRRLAVDRRLQPDVCRFLQGNPYATQNEVIVNDLIRSTRLSHVERTLEAGGSGMKGGR